MLTKLNVIEVHDNKKLGERVGLWNTERWGKPCRKVGCRWVVLVKDYAKNPKDVIREYFKCKNMNKKLGFCF